ncbi:MAG: fibronectin type III domain-containing protein, partial [Elusimicrobiota bacterium]|nr:fibronectin type III domain-containing protein [Elusimicrobiota bacterium]
GGGAAATNRGAGGGGSGGAVSITVADLLGGGTIYALGGAGGADADDADDPGGGGGGGRVALSISQNGTACLISVSTHGGASGGGTAGAGAGGTFSSTTTLPAPALSATSVSSYSVTWGWSLVSNGQNYQVFDELDGAVSPLLGPTEVEFVEEGLLPNTTYTRTVRVTACGAGTSSLDAAAATLTSTPTVVAQPFSEVWTASMTVAWQAFPAAPDELSSQGYRVEASSTDFGVLSPGGLVHSTETTSVLTSALSVWSPPLQPNTTYFFRIAGLNWAGAVGPYQAMGSTPTLATPAGAQPVTFLGVHFTSITAQWVAGDASGYTLEASSTDFGALAPGGVTSSSSTWAPTLTTLTVAEPPLSVDTLYYLRVGALNHAGRPNYSVLGGTRTRFQVNEPLAAATLFTDLSSAALTVNWDANGNPPDSLYHAEVSEDPSFLSVVTATDTYELFYATAGLTANTTYHFRVFASTRGNSSGWTVLGATMTHAPFPAMAASPFVAVHESSFTVRWSPQLNPPSVSSYTVVVTTGFFWPNDYAGNAVLASTRPSGADAMATVTGLEPNTEYQVFVAALNWTGAPGAYAFAGSTATFPRPPTAPAFDELSYSSAVVTFSVNGNPVGTSEFTVVLSTVASYPPGGAADVEATTVPTAGVVTLPVTGLSVDTTYYLSVKTAGFAHDSAYAAGGSSVTRAAPPGPSPDFTDYDPVATTGFTLNWSSGSAATGFDRAGTTYYAQISPAASFSPVTASSRTFNLSAAFSALAVNTSYYARVAAFSHHHGTWTAFSDFGSTATLAAIPAAPFVFNAVHFSSMTIRWAANGNPLTVTTYTVALSTTNAWPNADADTVVLTTAPGGAFPSATPTGLNSGTTYYLFVAALNHRGASTAYASFGSTRTKTSPKTWVGGVDLLWQTAGNWSPAGVPQQTDAVTIAANVTVTADASARISFSSLT